MKNCKSLIRKFNKFKNAQRLDKALTLLFPEFSRSKIKKYIKNGLIKVNNNIIKSPKKKIHGMEVIEIKYINNKNNILKGENINLNIVYEDDYIIIINKQCNFIVHPCDYNKNGTMVNALIYYYPPIINVPRAGIVHRLDKNTTGLMVIAKTLLAQKNLVNLFKQRKISREYEAIVTGVIPKGGIINKPISRNPKNRTNMIVHPSGKPAVTHYNVISHFRGYTRLYIRLETGRTHQIRVHMSHIRYPILGDIKYNKINPTFPKGASKYFKLVLKNFNRQALHATFLKIYHPITLKKMQWHAPLPKDILIILKHLYEDKILFFKKKIYN